MKKQKLTTTIHGSLLKKLNSSEGARLFGPDKNIHHLVPAGQLEPLLAEMEEKAAAAYSQFLEALLISQKDPNTRDTAKRVAKAMVREKISGRYLPSPASTEFPTPEISSDDRPQLMVTGPLTVHSGCSHHFESIVGKAWIGVLPSTTGTVLGLSKYTRILRWVCSRPSIQENLTHMVADEILRVARPEAIGVCIRAKHFCAICRGVHESEESVFTTTALRGAMYEPALRDEFYRMIQLSLS